MDRKCLLNEPEEKLYWRSWQAEEEVSELQRELEHLRSLVYTDDLTGLPNMRAFEMDIQEVLGSGKAFGVCYIDLNRFKAINDRYGHADGDLALIKTAERLKHAVRSDAKVYRKCGDEFLLLIEEPTIQKTARRVRQSFEMPVRVNGKLLMIGASLGVSLSPAHGVTVQDLLMEADFSMYEEKNSSRSVKNSNLSSPTRGVNGSPFSRNPTNDIVRKNNR
ncbi:GGDEF domain-containing protein [Bhargavaea cecembensis]|uniref:GGDEF domain-containing protein n=1 Tax=Bhargavaea cecembensis TaxID=394098 RepID=UPI000590EFC7|nr:GGDEF domain-containing protein [Bhargavaea cecembensis]